VLLDLGGKALLVIGFIVNKLLPLGLKYWNAIKRVKPLITTAAAGTDLNRQCWLLCGAITAWNGFMLFWVSSWRVHGREDCQKSNGGTRQRVSDTLHAIFVPSFCYPWS